MSRAEAGRGPRMLHVVIGHGSGKWREHAARG